MLISPSDNTQVPGLVFGPELLREVKSQVSSPSLPSRTFTRAKRERIRKGLIGEKTVMKEEQKARQADRRAEKSRNGDVDTASRLESTAPQPPPAVHAMASSAKPKLI